MNLIAIGLRQLSHFEPYPSRSTRSCIHTDVHLIQTVRYLWEDFLPDCTAVVFMVWLHGRLHCQRTQNWLPKQNNSMPRNIMLITRRTRTSLLSQTVLKRVLCHRLTAQTSWGWKRHNKYVGIFVVVFLPRLETETRLSEISPPTLQLVKSAVTTLWIVVHIWKLYHIRI